MSAHHDHPPLDRSDPAGRVARHQATGRGAVRVPYPIRVRDTHVLARTMVTPRMLRLTLGGEGLAEFHSYAAEDHVKLVFADEDGTRRDPVNNDHDLLDWPRPLPRARAYTVRRYDPDALELDLDVVVHDGGLASDWAVDAQLGERVVVAGPPGGMAFARTHRHYVLAVDTTGLPAAARWLDEADHLDAGGATATALVDYDHEDETGYPLRGRPGVEIRWLSRAEGSRLAETVAGLELPQDTFVFAAGEAGDIKPIRRWAREHGYDLFARGYWKRGQADFDED